MMPSFSSGVWVENLLIHSYDVDFKQRATLEAVCRYFLEAAWNHAEALGVGYSQLAKQSRLWVLARLVVKVGTRPRWGETVHLSTWPRPARSVFALRDFEMVDRAGAQLLGGSSAWVVLDSNTRRPQRIDKLLTCVKAFPERIAIGQDPVELPPSEGAAADIRVTTNYSDIDVNQHVSSANYVTWLLDSYPLEFHQNHDVQVLEANYTGETRGGEVLSIRSRQDAPDRWSHSIFKSDATEVCRARIQWAPHLDKPANLQYSQR